MERLMKSSNFWNAVIATVLAILAFKFGLPEGMIYGLLALFGVRGIATGAQDVVKSWSK